MNFYICFLLLLIAPHLSWGTDLVSINTTSMGSGNLGSARSQITSDGRFVVFTSRASDLVVNDNNGDLDIFVRDLQAGTTTLVSINATGTGSGNDQSEDPQITPDGRFVVFTSRASDLVVNDNNRRNDVFVRDLQAGTTTLVSVNATDTGSGIGPSGGGQITPDGQFVSFISAARDLVINDNNGLGDVFVRDLQAGTTTLVSINSAGTNSGNNSSFSAFRSPQITSDGRFVVFISAASDLVVNDNNGDLDTFVRDLQAGITTLVSVNATGTDSGNGGSSGDQITPDGRFVSFTSRASDLVVNDSNGLSDGFVRDLQAGTTTLVTVNTTGTDSGNSFSGVSQITLDGRFVVFVSDASNLVVNDSNGLPDVFVRDLQAGTTTLVSVNAAGTDSGNGSSGSDRSKITPDGRFVVFVSDASNLVVNDSNGRNDVFVRDLWAGTTTLVNVNATGTDSGNGGSGGGQITPDGRFVSFTSAASDLVANDNNEAEDVFRFLNPRDVSAEPVVMLDPATINFGTQIVNTTSPEQSVMLSNTGTAVLNIDSIETSGDFDISSENCGDTLAAGANCTINVTFTPKDRGQRTAELTVNSDAVSSPDTIDLNGIGTATAPGLSAATSIPTLSEWGIIILSSLLALIAIGIVKLRDTHN